MADHNKPVLTSTYANFVSELDARFDDLALGLDPAVTSATNLPVNSLRWNSLLAKDQKWNGSTWVDKSSFYALGSVRFNNGTVSAPSITFGDDTTTGISKVGGAVSVSTAGVERLSITNEGLGIREGNLSFTGTGNRILGDFSNTTPVNRVMFQSSVVNGTTILGVVPNGTSTASQVDVYSSSNLANSSVGQIAATSSDVRIVSGIVGTGSYLPLKFFTAGTERVQIDTSGNLIFTVNRIRGDFSNAALSSRLMFQTTAADSSTDVSVIPSGTGTVAALRAYSSSDPVNSSNISIQSAGTEVRIESNKTGTGSYLPIVFNTGGSEAYRINTNRSVSGLSVTEINGGQLAGMRNKIINGKTEIAQRGTSFTAAAAGYHLDRWQFGANTSAVVTVSQQIDAPVNTAFQNSLRYAVTTADTSISSGDFFLVSQLIEGYNVRDLVGKPFTISFWVRSSNTGIHCLSFRNAGPDRSYIVEYTIYAANTWEYKTITVSGGLPSAGTWNYSNGIGLTVSFALACGSLYQTTAGAWNTGNFIATANQVNCLDTVDNIFAITGVQLEVGSVATPFEHRPRGVEELLCKRYTHVILAGDVFLAGGVAVASTTVGQVVSFPAPMRATPSLSTTLVYSYQGTVASGSVNLLTNNVFTIQALAGGQYIMEASSGSAIFSAEL